VVKQLWRLAKVRYHLLTKNVARADHVRPSRPLQSPVSVASVRREVPLATPICETTNTRYHIRAVNNLAVSLPSLLISLTNMTNDHCKTTCAELPKEPD
jgi:hypothetical protein